MAVFNPNPQEVQIEDYRGFSHPISPVEGNKALGTALAGVGQIASHAGEMVKDIGKVQEFNTRQDIANDPDLAKANALRDQQTSAYETYNEAVRQARADTGQPIDLIAAGGQKPEDLPPDLQNFPQVAGKLAQAKLDARQNAAYLTAQVDDLAKKMRSKYPDHLDYIDNEFKKAGFGNTANERLHAAQQLYLQAQAGRDDVQKEALSTARSHIGTVPGLDQDIADITANKPGSIPAMYKKVNSYLTTNSNLQQAVNRQDLTDKLSSNDMVKAFDDFAVNTLNNGMQDRYEKQGLRSEKQIADEVAAYQTGKKTLDGPAIERLTLEANAAKQRDYNIMWNEAYKKGANGHSAVELMGGPGILKERINNHLTQYDNILSALKDGKVGLAQAIPSLIKAKTDTNTWRIMGDPELGPKVQTLQVASQINPQWAATLFQNDYSFFSDAMQIYFKHERAAQVTEGKPVKDALWQIANRANGIEPQAAMHFIDGVKDIWKTPAQGGLEDEGKRQAFKSFFDNANNGLLKFFPHDRVEKVGDQHIEIPGRLSIYRNLTDPRVISEAKRLGPQTFNMLKDWTEKEFYGSIAFDKIRNLEQISDQIPKKYYDIGWNDKTGEFHVKGTPELADYNKRAFGTRKGSARFATQYDPEGLIGPLLKDINEGLKPINELGRIEGKEPTTYALRMLQKMQIDLSGISGIPQEMLGSLKSSTMMPVINAKDIREGETPQEAIKRKKAEQMAPVLGAE